MSIGVNNRLMNSHLFSRRNIEAPNGYEDLSVIQLENNDNCNFDVPSTSTAFRPPRTVNITNNRDLSSIDMRRNNIENSGRILSNSVRSNTFINSTVRRDHAISNRDFPLNSNNLRNMSALPRSFGLSSRNSTLNGDLSQWNNVKLNQDSNFRCNNEYNDMPSGKRTFGLGLRYGAPGENMLVQENLRTNFNINSTICRSSNNQINMSAMSTNFGPSARSVFNSGVQIEDSIQCNEDDTLNQTFRKPTMSKVLRCRNSTVPSKLFSHQNVEKHSRDFSNINGFNVTHISRNQDNFSNVRLPFVRQQSMLDNQSVAGSVISIASVKAQVMNVLENLHHSILNIAPNIPADVVRMEFDKAREGLESINEMSFALTVRENDAASVISHSSKYICSSIPDQMPGTLSNADRKFPLKSGKDLLKSLGARNGIGRNNLLLSQVNEEDRTVIHITESRNQLSDDEEEDSAMIFKKPAAIFNRKGKKTGCGLKIKTPQVTKNIKLSITNKIINLREWYPVAMGADLAFCGTTDEGTVMQTEAVKKRISNRKVALVNGLECNLIGNPSDCIVSVFPKQIWSQLQNGLTARWKILTKMLQKLQTSQENVGIYESTPRTRRKIPEKRKGEHETYPTPAKAISLQSNFKAAIKSPVKAAAKEKKNKGKSKDVKKVSPDKDETIPFKRKSPRRDSSSQKSEKGPVAQTRSGRTVKCPNKFWLLPGNDEVSSSGTTDTPKTVATSDMSSNKKSHKKLPQSSEKNSGKKQSNSNLEKEAERVDRVHSSTDDAELRTKQQSQTKRKREVVGDADSTNRKRSKSEKISEPIVASTVEDVEKSAKNTKVNKGKLASKNQSRGTKNEDSSRVIGNKENNKKQKNKICQKECNDLEDDFELQLDDIEIPEIAKVSGKPRLNRSQLRLVSMETPPLKYFNNNLRIKKVTPEPSPDWCISQRTNSEVKQFQIRRAQAHKRKIKTNKKKEEKTKNLPQSRDLKNVLHWVAEKEVRTPVGCSQLLKYVIPSRKQMEEEDEDDEEEEEFET